VRDALLSGTVENVSVKIKGDLALLPFANPKDGEFRFAGKVNERSIRLCPECATHKRR
jgi:uncharacterized protein YhdP